MTPRPARLCTSSSALGNHSSTIASVPTRKEDKAVVKQSEPVSPARAQAGFTHTLANMVERPSTTRQGPEPQRHSRLLSAATPEPNLEKAASDNCVTPRPLVPPRARVAASAPWSTAPMAATYGHSTVSTIPWSVSLAGVAFRQCCRGCWRWRAERGNRAQLR